MSLLAGSADRVYECGTELYFQIYWRSLSCQPTHLCNRVRQMEEREGADRVCANIDLRKKEFIIQAVLLQAFLRTMTFEQDTGDGNAVLGWQPVGNMAYLDE